MKGYFDFRTGMGHYDVVVFKQQKVVASRAGMSPKQLLLIVRMIVFSSETKLRRTD